MAICRYVCLSIRDVKLGRLYTLQIKIDNYLDLKACPLLDKSHTTYLALFGKSSFKAIAKMPVCDRCEDLCHDVVFKFVNTYDVQVTSKS